jgi:hypothetical protein
VLAGEMERPGVRYTVEPGWLASVTAARSWFGGAKDEAFLATSLTIGVSSAHTTDAAGASVALTAQDNRLGLLVGRNFAGIWSPYAVARVFGGPVFWHVDGEDVVGSDRHHYALGLGGSFTIAGSLDVVAEAAFLGERSVALGLGYSLWD